MKKGVKYVALFIFSGIVYLGYSNYQKLVIISGLSAKWVASGVFVADRTQASIEGSDSNFSPITWATSEVDFENKSVTTNVFGLQERKAIYRDGLGTVVTVKGYDESTHYVVPNRNRTAKNLPFPYGDLPQKDTIFSSIDYKKLEKIVDNYFAENTEGNTTRSLLVVYKNQIIAEKYVDGFDQNSKMLGWSMAKSIVSTVYGVLDQQNKININNFASIKEWENDERSQITINNLLQMNSGLDWEEDYTKISDVTKMLYLEEDMTKSQIRKPLVGKPNESWCYSSGTTNLLVGILRQKFNTQQENLDFWYSNLIDRMGMHSMLLEADLAGNYVGSSYAWATTRDWAKFGLLYLNKGNWNGDQIISEDWVKYVATPTNTSEGIYGAQFWLNASGKMPDAPKDLFFAGGYQGQKVLIIPSKDLVVVRTGVSYSKLKEQLKERTIKVGEKQSTVEFELNTKPYNDLLKNILSSIE